VTYSTRLPLCGEQLQLLIVTELNKDVDSPLVVVIMLRYLDLTSTANTVESTGELLSDTFDQVGQSRIPQSLQFVVRVVYNTEERAYVCAIDPLLDFVKLFFALPDCLCQGRDLSLTFPELVDNTGIC
jgi:hypothetical protein